MGMYDTIWANIKCAKCGKIQKVDFQTKDLECDLTNLHEGDKTVYFDEHDQKLEENEAYSEWYSFIHPSTQGDHHCSNCGSNLELIAIVRNNRILRVLDGRILSQEVI
jgi:DNA-directed RNA polymerase subunit RPC12/RpoP